MNEIAYQEIVVLEAIYNDSFKVINDTTISFVHSSSRYKCDIEFTVAYSPNYPNSANYITFAAAYLHKQQHGSLETYLAVSQAQQLNDAQGFVYYVIYGIDDEELQYEAVSESSSSEQQAVAEANHGLIPGRPCTEELFHSWFAEYVQRNKITLLEEDTWQHALLPELTGYEIWEAKRNEQLVEE